jgi:hypothetical protein
MDRPKHPPGVYVLFFTEMWERFGFFGGGLTIIGKYWDKWPHSVFFAALGGMVLVVSGVLFALLKPLKKSMPGV